ncbi:MAG: DNA primase [Trueperaceae bacterium]|nr:MAG: DNA primase [Trueperaceae bacterium]
MSDDAKEQIRARVDLAQLIGEQVVLKPAGRGQLKGLCPFHAEKTPSFHVHVDRGFFYCFGCGAKGDAFDYVMRTRGVGFVEALTMLGERTGIAVEPASPRQGRRRDLQEVNALALAFFRQHLDGGPALAYLEGRGLTRATIDAWELGFAPDAWDALLKHALTKGVRDDDLIAAGLLVESDRGRRYDRFRDRVIFPIRDGLGRLLGFAGRVLGDALPKYLNTPETDLFKKSELLYGLDRARAAIRASGEVVVVEGYMDVIALHQEGFPNAVAALGATLTTEQAEVLARLDARRVLLAFDADEAGQRAVLGGLDQSVGRRFLVQAVSVPDAKDPADVVLSGQREAFAAALRTGVSEVAFRFERVVRQHDATTDEGRRAVLEALASALQPRDVFDPVASELRRLVVDHLGLDGERLDAWLAARRPRRLDATAVAGMRRRSSELTPVRVLELEAIGLMLLEPERLRERVQASLAMLPETGDASELVTFAETCERHRYDDAAVVASLNARDGSERVLERILAHATRDASERPLDVDRRLEQQLSRIRELHLATAQARRQERLMTRWDELRRVIEDPSTPADALREAYGELAAIRDVQVAREGERQLQRGGRQRADQRRRGS